MCRYLTTDYAGHVSALLAPAVKAKIARPHCEQNKRQATHTQVKNKKKNGAIINDDMPSALPAELVSG